ncbi:MAG: TonB-dependent receptor [Opitutaceae bacterium]|nr:TonB-dependent receptor [Opitutaceae bacterium]
MNIQHHSAFRGTSSLRAALAAGLVLLLSAGTPVAFAQSTNTSAQPPKGEDEALQMETVVVKGFRESIAASLKAERAAKNIKNVISADALGNLPDNNVAEALSRLAGVSSTIADGDGRFVTIRGVEPGLNGITLNGETVATSDSGGRSGRSAPLDVLSTATAGQIEVHKTVTSDMDLQSIGGTINIITPSAFDYNRSMTFFGSAEGGLNDMNAKKDLYKFSLNYAQRFRDNKVGVFGSFYNSRTPYRSQEAEIRRYNFYTANNYFLPDEIRLSQKDGHRGNTAATVNLEYRPDDNRRFYLRLYTTEYENYLDRPQNTIRFRHGAASSPTAGIATLRTATYEGRISLTERTTEQIVAGGELPLTESLKLSASANYSKAEENWPLLTYVQFLVSAPNLATIQASGPSYYDITNADSPRFTFTPQLYQPQYWDLSIVRPEQTWVYEKTKTGRADLEWKGEVFGKNTTIKTGVKALERRKSVFDIASGYTPRGPAAGTKFTSDFGTGPLGTPGPTFQDGRYYFGLQHNTGALLKWLDDTLPEVPSPNPYVDHGNANWLFQTAYALGNSLEDFYFLTEKISAAYLMATVDVNPRLSIFGGVRFEHTDESLSSNLFLAGAQNAVEGITLDHDYNTFLPNLQFRYDVNEKMVLRGALTYTIGRPDFLDMVPIAELTFQDTNNNGLYEGTLETGNPELKPYESMNVDVFLTRYLPYDGAISLGYFHKRIKNPIYDWFREDIDVVFAGRNFETLYRESRFNANPGTIDGIEVTYQQNFKFLPAPFDGFGVVFNYAWIESSVSTFDRPDEVTFFRQPDSILNAQLYFENRRFDARLAYHYQGANLEGIGASPIADSYGDERGMLDFKGSVRLDDNWAIYAEVRNITNDTDRNYQGDPRYITLINQFGITYLAGVTFKY